MTRLTLVTGFLGAGKTTLLKSLIERMKGGKIALIINDFGREAVDEKLLAECGAYMSGVTGGSIFCACRLDHFEIALCQALENAPDDILVETSGLSDPTGVGKVLTLRAEFADIDYRGCVCLCDARSLYKIHDTCRVSRSQLDMADLALVSKLDIATPDQAEKSLAAIMSHVPREVVYPIRNGKIDEALGKAIDELKPRDKKIGPLIQEVGLHKLSLKVGSAVTKDEIEAFLLEIAPNTLRVKGFASGYFVDCVGAGVQLRPCDGETDDILTVLYGYGLSARGAIEKAAKGLDISIV